MIKKIDPNFRERWVALEIMLTERFGKLPNMEAILYLIGINELEARAPKLKFSKEQKQDLMHIAVCTLLGQIGYFKLTHLDEDGWPHFKELKPVAENTMLEQEILLKEQVLEYFQY